MNNLYLDTRDLANFTANTSGVSRREKVRLRWYGDGMTVIRPMLERKQKSNMLGRKLQLSLSCDLDLRWPWREILETLRTHVSPDWGSRFLSVYQPSLLNRYQREYYVTPDGLVRVTLDFAQAVYDQRIVRGINTNRRTNLEDSLVIEIKADRDHVDRLTDVVSHFPISRSRNSKYANGVLAALG